MSRLYVPIAFLSLLFAPGLALADSDHDEGKAPLVRPANPLDADAKGEIEIKHDDRRDKFKVEAERLDTQLTFEVFLEDALGSANLVSIGTLSADDDEHDSEELELEFKSDEGPLPFGVAAVADLAGRQLEVRSGADVYLLGVVPVFGGGGSDDGKWQKGKTDLTRPPSPADDNAKGKLEIRSRTKDNRQRFKVEAEHLSTGDYFVFLEDALGSDNLVNVGAMTRDGDDDHHRDSGDAGEYELKLDTGKGDQLPLGVLDVAELVGHKLEIRDGVDTVYLLGVVPELGSSGGHDGKAKGESKLTGTTGKGEVEVETNPRKGREEFEVEVKRQVRRSTVDLFVEDPSNHTLSLVASLATNGSGKAKYRVRTQHGASLPFGVASVTDLGGLAVEIRETGSSTVLLSGTVPTLSP